MASQDTFELALSYYNGTGDIQQDYQKAYDLFLDAAEHGHVGAQSYLGRMLSMGEGVEKNYEESVKWLKRAAESGDADAQNRLGVRCNSGQGIEKDSTEAAKWFTLSAEQGHIKALNNLGVLYMHGDGVKQDYSKSLELFHKSASAGYSLAQFYLGMHYLHGYDIPIDYDEALKWFILSAKAGNVNAQLDVGYIYRNGLGRDADVKEALKWYMLAAEQGNIHAQSIIGFIYRDGAEGIPQDYAESFKWFMLAAEQGEPISQCQIGYFYQHGLGVDVDHNQGLYWYLKASEAGDAMATCNIGVLYSNGIGVNQDSALAFKYFLKAAEMGFVEAMDEVGYMYEYGEGVDKDVELAKEWFKKAYENGCYAAANSIGYLESGERAIEWFKKGAEKGDVNALYNLGRLYHQGSSVETNYEEAFKWYKLAAKEKSAHALNNLGVMYSRGQGTEVDFLKAKECFLEAIENEGYFSLSNMGDLWFDGKGIEKNIAEAIRIYSKGYHEYSNVFSLMYLSNIYMFGIGVPKDYRLAVSILKKIYRFGIDMVCYNLGCAYYNGNGVAQNKEIALSYWNKVKDYDNDAMSALNSVDDIKFKFINTTIQEGSPFHAEMSLMFQNHDEAYIERCLQKAKLGDYDAMYNMLRIMVRREDRDIRKEEFYFNELSKALHPQALYLDSIFTQRNSITEIDFTTPYYIDEIIESQFENPTDDEQLSALFVIYTILKGYDINNLPNNLTQSTLYSIYTNILQDDSQRQKLEAIRRLCSHKALDILLEEYKEYLVDVLEGDMYGTTLYPSKNVIDLIHNHLSKEDNNEKFDLIGGAVNMGLFSNPNTYNLYVKNRRSFDILNLLLDLSDLENRCIYNQSKPNHVESSIIITIPELRRHQGQDFDLKSVQIQELNYILDHRSSYKKAVILVDREFCSCINTEMYETRKMLFFNQQIEKVIELPKGTFNDIAAPTALIFLNFTTPINEVKFISEESDITVSYTSFKENDYCINSKLYNQCTPSLDNYKEYRFCDLIDINQSSDFFADVAYQIDDSAYNASLLYAVQSRTILHQKKNQINTYKGPHIILRYENGVKLYIHRADSTISCSLDSYAIKVNTAVIENDYMAYILLDKATSEYLSDVVDENGMFMPRDLLYRKISIPIDKAIQKQIVEDALVKERQMSGSGVEYNVILLSEQSDHLEKQLNEKGINIFQRISSVNDGECTFEDLYEQYIEDPSKALIDAIIIDTKIDDYEDVLFYFRTIRERNIQIYLLGEKDEIRISGSKLKEYFLKENRVFNQAADEYLDKLLNKMRDDLDSSNAPQAKIRNKYKAVFEAADALDKKYPEIGVSKAVLRYIQTGCNIEDVDNVSGPCGSFRNVCHKLLQVFVSKKLVPDIDPGAIPVMLKDGKFYDSKTQRTYILKEQFMSKYLSRALEYFCKVTNEGVHGSQDSSRLGTAALNILMEFIVWFYENDICSNKLDNIPVNPCYEDITDKLPSLKGKVCTVKAQGAGKDRYLYADNIHIKENKSLKPGMKIKIKDVGAEMIADDDRRKIDDEYMVFYTSSYDIL